MATIFITGGSGYLGRNYIRTAVARGDTVRALARSDAAAAAVTQLGAIAIRGDLADTGALRAGMKGATAVVHSAAWVQTWGDAALAHAVTVDGTQNVLDACLAANVERVVHVSTEACLVDGAPIVNANETRPLPKNPVGLYPTTKGEAERRVHAAVARGLHAVIVRPRAIWGNDDTVMAANLVTAIDSGRFAWIDGGRPFTSTCHVDNVVEGIDAAMTLGGAGEIYFLTDGVNRTIRAFFGAVIDRLGLPSPTKSVPRGVAHLGASLAETIWGTFKLERDIPVNKTEVMLIGQEVTVDDTKARETIGYKGMVDFETGLRSLDVDMILATARPG